MVKINPPISGWQADIQRVMVLVDLEEGLELVNMDMLDDSAVSWALVTTKVDKLKAAQSQRYLLRRKLRRKSTLRHFLMSF